MEDKTVDWVAWHSPTQILSLCAGQGRDLFDVLEQFPAQRNVHALHVENDPYNVEVALNRVHQFGLVDVDIRCADAGNSKSYVGATPADLVFLCGVFGNISDQDVFKTIEFLPQLCSTGATVLWTLSLHPKVKSFQWV